MPELMQFVFKSAPDIPRQYLTPAQTRLLHHYWNTPSPDRGESLLKKKWGNCFDRLLITNTGSAAAAVPGP